MSYCKKQLIQSESEYRLVGEDLRNKNLVVVLVVDRVELAAVAISYSDD